MLQITGKCVDVTTSRVTPPAGATWQAFDSTTIHLLSGAGRFQKVEQLRVGSEFPADQMPTVDEDDVRLIVSVAGFNTKGGGGYRLTALSRADVAGSRALRAASNS